MIVVYTISKAKSGDHFIVLWVFNDLPDVGSPIQLLEACEQLETGWLAGKLLLLSSSPPILSLSCYLLHLEQSRISLTPNMRLFSVMNIVLGWGQLWAINTCIYYKDNRNLGQRP